MNLILRVFLLCVIWHSENLFATSSYEAIPEDYELSKKSFLISKAPYEKLIAENKGAMTLCFAPQSGSKYEHTALAFEYFHPKTPSQISVTMIHFGKPEDCCCGLLTTRDKVLIETHKDTITKVHRSYCTTIDFIADKSKTEITTGNYKKYATWYIKNSNLLDGIKTAYNEADNNDNSKRYKPPSLFGVGPCVQYATHIMQKVGLEKLNFGTWWEKPDNLKRIVRDYAVPKPDKIF